MVVNLYYAKFVQCDDSWLKGNLYHFLETRWKKRDKFCDTDGKTHTFMEMPSLQERPRLTDAKSSM